MGYSKTETKLFDLDKQIKDLNNQRFYLQRLIGAELIDSNLSWINTAWVNPKTNRYYFVIDINPDSKYTARVITFEKFNTEKLEAGFSFASKSFSYPDIQRGFLEVQLIHYKDLKKCESITKEQFLDKMKEYCEWYLTDVSSAVISYRENQSKEAKEELKEKGLLNE